MPVLREVERLPRTLEDAAARRVAADLLSRRPWTCAELTARLRRRGAPEAVAAAVVADLTARGHLDDARFARQWVEARSSRGYGPARLAAELRVRGVAAPEDAVEVGLQRLVVRAPCRPTPGVEPTSPEHRQDALRRPLVPGGQPTKCPEGHALGPLGTLWR